MLPSDAALMQAAQEGSADDFERLVQRHQQSIWAYLVRRVGSDRAEDLLSEVWLRAFRYRASYDHSFDSARPWLFRIARHVMASETRHETTGGFSEEAVDPWSEVERRMHSSEIRDALLEAVAALSRMQREVLLLFAWEELSPTEIAFALELPPSTIRSHLRRARLALEGSRHLFEISQHADTEEYL